MIVTMGEFENCMKFILFMTDNEHVIAEEDKNVMYLYKEIALLLTESALKGECQKTGAFMHLPEDFVKITAISKDMKDLEERFGKYVADILIAKQKVFEHEELLYTQFFIHYIVHGNTKEMQEYMDGWRVRSWKAFTSYKAAL